MFLISIEHHMKTIEVHYGNGSFDHKHWNIEFIVNEIPWSNDFT